MLSMFHKLTGAVPSEVHPVLTSVMLTTIDIEMCLKIVSLTASLLYLFWRWRVEYKQIKNQKKENE